MREESSLLRRARGGDADAFEELMAAYEKRVYALCFRLYAEREGARDCAQETMLRIWRALPFYREQGTFCTWVFRVATNTCLDMLRKKKTRPAVSLDALSEEGEILTSDDGDPQKRAESSDRLRLLSQGIATLTEDMRVALVLRDIHGLSYDEVSDILGASLGTIKSRINRAREKLRNFLSADRELFDLPRVYEGERGEDA